PGSLGLRTSPCGDQQCVSWVMPAGEAWGQGVRPGMVVIPSPPDQPDALAIQPEDGPSFTVEVTTSPISSGALKFSFFTVSSVFAILGSLVLLRRPSLGAARLFALFSVITALGMGVAPSSGGPAPAWALALQFLTITGMSAAFVAYAMFLYSRMRWRRGLTVAVMVVLGAIYVGYPVAAVVDVSFYDVVRPISFLFMAAGILGGIAIFVAASRSDSATERESGRVALWGTSLGFVPFVALTLVPEAVAGASILPAYATIAPIVLVPVSFAVAILRHNLMGIRRLVHRGMVYAMATLGLLVFLPVVIGVAVPEDASAGVVSVVAVFGAIAFLALRNGAKWFVDRYVYRDVLDQWDLLGALETQSDQEDALNSVAAAIAQRVGESLHVDSVLILYKSEGGDLRTIGAAGPRQSYVAEQLADSPISLESSGLIELSLASEQVVASVLGVFGRPIGILVVGPKTTGDVFVDWEKRVIAGLSQILGIAIQRSDLAQNLRGMSRRLVQAEERERARIAGDLHDGPLQKALMLAGDMPWEESEEHEIAAQLASELREITSRLRPAILDDLGLVPALEWLASDAADKGRLTHHFEARGVEEYDRFPNEIELALFRVTQEAMNHIVKHASAKEVRMQLTFEGKNLVLEVSDDGKGFKTNGERRPGGMGLTGMRDRLSQISGSLEVTSEPNHGTRIIASVPVKSGLRDQSLEETRR
ncbi:MAG: ATP-binding protein, partial [Dehalococcoidia bacterium]